jgi:hypothetical protein
MKIDGIGACHDPCSMYLAYIPCVEVFSRVGKAVEIPRLPSPSSFAIDPLSTHRIGFAKLKQLLRKATERDPRRIGVLLERLFANRVPSLPANAGYRYT